MKKQISKKLKYLVFCILTLLGILLFGNPNVFAGETTLDGIKYQLLEEGNECTITNIEVKPSTTKVKIPSEITIEDANGSKTYTVTGIKGNKNSYDYKVFLEVEI